MIPENVKALKYESYNVRRVSIALEIEKVWGVCNHVSDIFKFAATQKYDVKKALDELLRLGQAYLTVELYWLDSVCAVKKFPVFWVEDGYQTLMSEIDCENTVVGVGCKRFTKTQMLSIINWANN